MTISTNESVDVVGPASLKIRVGNDGQEEVRFKLKAKLIGNATLKFAAGKEALILLVPLIQGNRGYMYFAPQPVAM